MKTQRAGWARCASLRLLCLAFATTSSFSVLAVEKQDHVHLSLKLAIAAEHTLPKGNVLGLYAVEVLACPAKQSSLGFRDHLVAVLNRVADMVMSSAMANHRDRFDRAGARIVQTRVPLDRAGNFPLGAVVVPEGLYCQVRLSLTRLPSTVQPTELPALETSVHLTRPGALAPLAVGYVVPIEISFATPWRASHGQAELSIALEPSSAKSVLADASLGEGALVRLVSARWAATGHLKLKQTR